MLLLQKAEGHASSDVREFAVCGKELRPGVDGQRSDEGIDGGGRDPSSTTAVHDVRGQNVVAHRGRNHGIAPQQRFPDAGKNLLDHDTGYGDPLATVEEGLEALAKATLLEGGRLAAKDHGKDGRIQEDHRFRRASL